MVRKYLVTLTNVRPILLHADNVEWADEMEAWKADPANAKLSKPGDDRTPPYRWLGSLYHDERVVVVPSDNIMRALMEGGALVPVPGGKNGKTFKSQTQSGCMPEELYWPLLVRGQEIPVAPFFADKETRTFAEYAALARTHGFSLYVKRAKVGSSKHVRVRPRFDAWTTRGHLIVTDDQLSTDKLVMILEYAGRYKGLGDWRPGSPRAPGPYGQFEATVKQVR